MDDDTSHEIPGDYIGELVEAIADAYRQKAKLDLLLRSKLNKKPHKVASVESTNMSVVAYAVVDSAEAEGWLHNLIMAVGQDQPDNPFVKAFYTKYKEFIRRQHANHLPGTALGVSYPLMAPPIISLPSQGKRHQTHPPSDAQQTVEHFSHERDSASSDERPMPPMFASSVVLPQPQSGPQFSFRYFRGAGCYSSGMYGSSGYNFTRQPFLREAHATLLSRLLQHSYENSLR